VVVKEGENLLQMIVVHSVDLLAQLFEFTPGHFSNLL
jgi:hypothetical protein